MDIFTIAETMREIQRDCKDDALRTEGLPLTGRNVGELFGSTLAMISAVAYAVELLDDRLLQDHERRS